MLVTIYIPAIAFVVLAAWGLKDEELYWGEVGVCAAVVVVFGVVCYFSGWPMYLMAVPLVLADIWMIFKLFGGNI
ncbi:MAG: hypothetical protein WD716_09045 [Fimbriimonadaceae bacterium]